MSTYARAKLLGTPLRRSRGGGASVEDRAAFARALTLLGQTRYSSNLNQLAHLANLGALAITVEIEDEILSACASIQEVRQLLMKALGTSAGGAE